MRTSEHTISVSYSQLAVFDPSLDRPFNQWSDRHVAQGFAWRPGSVAFRTLDDGDHILTVRLDAQEGEPSRDAVRVIDVPFEVLAGGAIEIGSIADSVVLEMPPGSYQLRFEGYEPAGSEQLKVCLSFRRTEEPWFKVVNADSSLDPGAELLVTASPA